MQVMDSRTPPCLLPTGCSVAGIQWGVPPFPSGQAQFIRDMADGARSTGVGGLAIAPTRSGKTLCSLQAACDLGFCTLILVDSDSLRRQWRRDIEAHVRDANGNSVSVGIIQQDKFEVDHPFVIAMVQTLANRQLDSSARARFGTVIVDECQSAPCDLIMGALVRVEAAYVLGLSATPDRKDGLGKAIGWLIGPVIAVLEREMHADVLFVPLPFRDVPFPHVSRHGNVRVRRGTLVRYGKIDRNEVEKAIMHDEEHISTVANHLWNYHIDGRHVLAFVGLREHAFRMRGMLQSFGGNPGLYIGGQTNPSEMEKSPCISTFRAGGKGVDFRPPPTLLAICAPISDVRQVCGRGLQPQAPCTPMIMDVVPQHDALVRQACRRLEYYREREFNILNDPWGN